mmetsp:Transcript_15282/g.44374  ORF Transcript_15282/g.44374 Transcript_15282/m.44374 type:complete len:86 (-) Transcript_15282:22-279(-)
MLVKAGSRMDCLSLQLSRHPSHHLCLRKECSHSTVQGEFERDGTNKRETSAQRALSSYFTASKANATDLVKHVRKNHWIIEPLKC